MTKSMFRPLVLSLAFLAFSSPYINAYAQSTVEIVGEVDCDGVYSETCGWGPGGSGGENPPGGSDSGGGGDGAGSNGPYTYDDGTRGDKPIHNRLAGGCQREALFMEEVTMNATYGQPMGTVIIDRPFKDPLYSGDGWVKMAADRYYSTGTPQSGFTRFYTHVHFMYNKLTWQVSQLKLKTSFEYGCKGFPKP